jgi:hypothetical protein
MLVDIGETLGLVPLELARIIHAHSYIIMYIRARRYTDTCTLLRRHGAVDGRDRPIGVI